MKVKPYYTWYWLDGMHIGYTPERIRVEGRGGAVGFIGLCWLIDYVVIPAVLWTVLALFGQAPA